MYVCRNARLSAGRPPGLMGFRPPRLAHRSCISIGARRRACQLSREPRIMDFEATSPGTLAGRCRPAAALTARGPDHNVEYPAADDFETVLGNALKSAAAAAPNRRAVAYSSASGALSGFVRLQPRPPDVCMDFEYVGVCDRWSG